MFNKKADLKIPNVFAMVHGVLEVRGETIFALNLQRSDPQMKCSSNLRRALYPRDYLQNKLVIDK